MLTEKDLLDVIGLPLSAASGVRARHTGPAWPDDSKLRGELGPALGVKPAPRSNRSAALLASRGRSSWTNRPIISTPGFLRRWFAAKMRDMFGWACCRWSSLPGAPLALAIRHGAPRRSVSPITLTCMGISMRMRTSNGSYVNLHGSTIDGSSDGGLRFDLSGTRPWLSVARGQG